MHHDYRVEKARRFLELAHLAYEHGYYETAVSRAYYSVYHMVAWALAEHRGIDRSRWDHIQVHKTMLESFCKPGYLLNAADGVTYRYLLEERVRADYTNKHFNEREVGRLLARAGALVSKILEANHEA